MKLRNSAALEHGVQAAFRGLLVRAGLLAALELRAGDFGVLGLRAAGDFAVASS
jgi:hypothetical protein